jgi:hypothetical protein
MHDLSRLRDIHLSGHSLDDTLSDATTLKFELSASTLDKEKPKSSFDSKEKKQKKGCFCRRIFLRLVCRDKVKKTPEPKAAQVPRGFPDLYYQSVPHQQQVRPSFSPPFPLPHILTQIFSSRKTFSATPYYPPPCQQPLFGIRSTSGT